MKIRKVLGAIALIVILMTPAFAATFTTFDDFTNWETAVGGCFVVEDFSDTTLNDGLTVEPGPSGISGGVWYDQVSIGGGGGGSMTTWSFEKPITAFGGDFDLYNVMGPGSGINILVDGSWIGVGYIDGYATGFWGFVSDTPFTKVRFTATTNGPGVETYTLDNLVYKYAPQAMEIRIRQKINIKAKGVFQVGIFGSGLLDVTNIDPTSIKIGEIGIVMNDDPPVHFEDINDDGYMDLICHFSIPELVETCELTETTTELTVSCMANCHEFVGMADVVVLPQK